MKPYFQRFSALAKHQAFTCDVSYSLHAESAGPWLEEDRPLSRRHK